MTNFVHEVRLLCWACLGDNRLLAAPQRIVESTQRPKAVRTLAWTWGCCNEIWWTCEVGFLRYDFHTWVFFRKHEVFVAFVGICGLIVGAGINHADDGSRSERLVRHLAANNLLEEVSPGKFKQTAFTLALLEPKYGEWINFMYYINLPSRLWVLIMRQIRFGQPLRLQNARVFGPDRILESIGSPKRYFPIHERIPRPCLRVP